MTANKALIAECGTELAQLAHQNGADLFYEAAVGGGIPILRALRTSLAGERIDRVMGIVNGTTNFILSKMTSEGSDYGDGVEGGAGLGLRRVPIRAPTSRATTPRRRCRSSRHSPSAPNSPVT